MKHVTVFFFISCLFFYFPLKAQQNHFIYIQTENKQPFYVKLDNKVFSSSVTGYVVVPKLKSGNYIFTIGFLKSEWPDQVFRCIVADKDLGYLLKNFGDKGWGFFNLQTLQVLMANKIQDQPIIAADDTSDAFSTLLSTVVNDPTIKQKDPVKIVVKEKPKSEPVAVNQVVTAVVNEPVISSLVKTISPVIKKQSRKTSEGVETVYLDSVDGTLDTITILMATDKVTNELTAVLIDTPIITTGNTLPNQVVTTTKPPTKFIEMELPNAITPVAKPDTGLKLNATKSPMINSDCKNFASNEDFMKLRKKMAAAENAEHMIELAKKGFKTRCFTTEQVKNLSVLFLKDSSKYDFFDTAYPFVSDSQNYASLESQLTDSYYINRFKVMIRH